MMNSLEVRSPFLDTKLVEFVYNLPTNFKMSKTENKIILKDILAEIFPRDFVYRRKQGFGAPIKDWLGQDKIKKMIEQTLKNPNSPMYKYLDKKYVNKIVIEFEQTKDNNDNSAHRLWILFCLGLWFREHVKFINTINDN